MTTCFHTQKTELVQELIDAMTSYYKVSKNDVIEDWAVELVGTNTTESIQERINSMNELSAD